jgi:chemotaxis protein CheX
MNVKFMNPFIDAASEVLRTECGTAIKRGSLTMQKSALTADDVTVLISLIGQVQGVVLYGLSRTTSLGLVTRMLGQEFTNFDNLAQSGIAELGNVVTGRATIKLSQAGFTANISPPTLIQGKGLSISTLDFARIVVPLDSEVGQITVHLALRESPPGMKDTNFVPLSVKVAG